MKIITIKAIFLIPLVLLMVQACADDTTSVDTRVIPAIAPKETTTIAPAPPPHILGGDRKTIIDGLLSRKLGFPTTHTVAYQKANATWSLQCGKALSSEGTTIDFAKSKLAKQAADGYLENNYCALFQKQGEQYKLVEFDYGSTDSQVFTWLQRHKIPVKILE